MTFPDSFIEYCNIKRWLPLFQPVYTLNAMFGVWQHKEGEEGRQKRMESAQWENNNGEKDEEKEDANWNNI